MSLRGSKTTEAILQGIENKEIATLPLVARNDEEGITTQSLKGGGGIINFPCLRLACRLPAGRQSRQVKYFGYEQVGNRSFSIII